MLTIPDFYWIYNIGTMCTLVQYSVGFETPLKLQTNLNLKQTLTQKKGHYVPMSSSLSRVIASHKMACLVCTM